MKNIRLFFSALSFVTFGVFGTAIAQRTESPANGNIKLQIERKEITKEQADLYRLNGTQISLGVYAIFSPEWKANGYFTGQKNVGFANSNISWAFYETEDYSKVSTSTDPSHYLQNPSDYMSICCVSGRVGEPANACYFEFGDDWYGSQQLQSVRNAWPTYAWGSGFNGGRIQTNQDYFTELSDGSYRVKLFDVQFKLNPSNTNYRSLPVGFLDDVLSGEMDGSIANCQLNPENPTNSLLYWPKNGATDQTCGACTTCQYCQDWTDLKQTSYFEFIPGGLFIQNGPDVETFEPYFE